MEFVPKVWRQVHLQQRFTVTPSSHPKLNIKENIQNMYSTYNIVKKIMIPNLLMTTQLFRNVYLQRNFMHTLMISGKILFCASCQYLWVWKNFERASGVIKEDTLLYIAVKNHYKSAFTKLFFVPLTFVQTCNADD